MSDWSECMNGQGLDYASPIDAISSSYGGEASSATAVVDVECKIETNLIGRAAGIQAAYDQEYIDANRGALDELVGEIESYLRGMPASPAQTG
ncbi:MAG: hypothetical protein LBK59_02485 [Bifidobacteriaceae bacterium]|nr:hypothetical protein [Bifidobacteriaceae bacterium]